MTISKEFFNDNPSIQFWRIEVIYQFSTHANVTTNLNLQINTKPANGFCFISPSNGTIDTLFTLNCSQWFDQDGIKDFSLFGSINNSNDEFLLVSTSQFIHQFQFPLINTEEIFLNLRVQIRDYFHSFIFINLSSINLAPICDRVNSSNRSIAYMINQRDIQDLEQLEFREDLIDLLVNLSISSEYDLKFQSNILSQLTFSTKFLTRKSLVGHFSSLHIHSKISFVDLSIE